jgi:hypothetical protein
MRRHDLKDLRLVLLRPCRPRVPRARWYPHFHLVAPFHKPARRLRGPRWPPIPRQRPPPSLPEPPVSSLDLLLQDLSLALPGPRCPPMLHGRRSPAHPVTLRCPDRRLRRVCGRRWPSLPLGCRARLDPLLLLSMLRRRTLRRPGVPHRLRVRVLPSRRPLLQVCLEGLDRKGRLDLGHQVNPHLSPGQPGRYQWHLRPLAQGEAEQSGRLRTKLPKAPPVLRRWEAGSQAATAPLLVSLRVYRLRRDLHRYRSLRLARLVGARCRLALCLPDQERLPKLRGARRVEVPRPLLRRIPPVRPLQLHRRIAARARARLRSRPLRLARKSRDLLVSLGPGLSCPRHRVPRGRHPANRWPPFQSRPSRLCRPPLHRQMALLQSL